MKRTSFVVWLSVALALALLAAIPVAAAPDKPKAMNARFMHWQENSHVIHIMTFWDDGRPGASPAMVDAGQPLLFGFEWAGESVEELQADLDDPRTGITVSVDGGPAIDVKGYYQPAFYAISESGPAWTWDHDGDGLGDGDGDGVGDWDGATAFFRYPHPGMESGTHTFVFTVFDPGLPMPFSDTITVVVP